MPIIFQLEIETQNLILNILRFSLREKKDKIE